MLFSRQLTFVCFVIAGDQQGLSLEAVSEVVQKAAAQYKAALQAETEHQLSIDTSVSTNMRLLLHTSCKCASSNLAIHSLAKQPLTRHVHVHTVEPAVFSVG